MKFNDQVYALVRLIPSGKVLNYGSVAALLGNLRGARAVGWALNSLSAGTDVPWWRVINAAGKVSIRSNQHSRDEQRRLLEAEGVQFDENESIRLYGQAGKIWTPTDWELLEIRNLIGGDS